MKVTVILIGSGGELDRITFTPRGDTWDLMDLAEAVEKENSSSWILGDGDTLKVIEE